jgi:hypothetical protein
VTTPRDRELERLLDDDGGEFGTLYRRLSRAEPPRRLDRAVLGIAARAVRGQMPRRHRWMVAFGSAASVVLAAGIAWHIGQDALREQSQSERARGAPIVVPVEPITLPVQRRHADEMSNADAKLPASTAPPSEPPRKPSRLQELEREIPARPTPPTQARIIVAPSPVAPMSASAPFPGATSQRDETPQAASTAAPASPTLESAPMPRNAPATDSRELAAPARIRGGAAQSPSSSAELRHDLQLAPADWLARIRQLMEQGQRQQAIESLRLFHETHPQHPISVELQALLE